ncbi:MAG: Gfo/Idh/MocA family oxidoreductase [Thermoguttaceae bacterium]
MNLSPEEKAVGKQNFLEAAGATRRDFLKGTMIATATAGATLGAAYYQYGEIGSERLRVGILGTGDEGGVLIGALNPDYVDVVAIADIRPYSIHRAFHGDNYSAGTVKARPGLMHIYDWKTEQAARDHVKAYEHPDGGYKQMLDDSELDIDAVIIALPLHLHNEAAIYAMRKGKHVLTEKLMGHSVAECKEMARVAEETGLILATGHQRHYSILYDNAVDQISSGLIGEIHHIRAQWHRNNLPGRDSWQPPLPCPFVAEEDYKNLIRAGRKLGKAEEQAVRDEYKLIGEYYAWVSKRDQSAGSEADTWARRVEQKRTQIEDHVVDAARYGYTEKGLDVDPARSRTPLEELIRWRLWDRTGGGLMAELGSHQLDAASIFISAQSEGHKKVMPLTVTGMGSRSLFPADRDVDDHVYTMYEFPAPGYYQDAETEKVANPNKKIVVTYSSINGNDFGGYGEVVLGTKGTLILEREKDAMLFKRSETLTKISVTAGQDGPAMDTYETGGGMAEVAAAAIPSEVSRGYAEEIEHWAWCIKNPSPEHQPKCRPAVALADAVVALTSNIAMAENRRIEFQPEWFDSESNATPDGKAPRGVSELA